MKKVLRKVALVSAFAIAVGFGTIIGSNIDSIQTALAVENTTVSVSNVWDGSYDIDWYDTSKTEFEISTPEQLAGLAKIVNNGNDMTGKTITLTNNILLNDISDYDKWSGPNDLGEIYSPANNWTAIGTSNNTDNTSKKFNGTFDGNGYSIIGLYEYNTAQENTGLFGYCNTDAKVQNIKLEKVFIYDNYTGISTFSTSTGGLIGTSKGITKNCYVNGSITSTYASYLGGVVGYNEITNISKPSPIIDSCCFEGTLTDTKGASTGGISGRNEGIVKYCYNNGNIFAESEAGGIVGVCGGGDGEIYECRNDGNVNSNYYAGGIIATSASVIDSCYNTGNISLDTDGYEAGGISGTFNNGTLQNCYSVGIVSSNSSDSYYYIGGVVGDGSKYYISNCYYKLDPLYKGDGWASEEYITGKSASAMKTEEFAELLGDKFVYVENSYPKLTWELNNNNLWKVGEDNQTDISTNPTPSGTDTEYSRFDVNRDGSVNILDLIELKRYILGEISE